MNTSGQVGEQVGVVEQGTPGQAVGIPSQSSTVVGAGAVPGPGGGVGAGGGAGSQGAGGSTSIPGHAGSPSAQPPATPPPPPAEIPLEERFEWDEGSETDSATLQELIDARRMLRTWGEDFQLFRRAISGDSAAIQAIVQRATATRPADRGGTMVGGNAAMYQSPGGLQAAPGGFGGGSTSSAQTPPTPPSPTPPAGINLEEWEQVRSWVERMRVNETRRGVAEFLQSRPEFHNLAMRPDGVDRVIGELNRVYAETKRPITPQVLENVVRILNNIETDFLNRVGAVQSAQAGELGLADLFRGGPVNPPEQTRPDFRSDPSGYQKYLAGRFKEAVREASGGGTV